MKNVFIFFIFLFFVFSCSKEKKAKDIVIEEIVSHCDCVSSFLLVISEMNVLRMEHEKKSNIDSSTYLEKKIFLESIMRSVDKKCIIYEGADSDLQLCDDYQNLLSEMELYGLY